MIQYVNENNITSIIESNQKLIMVFVKGHTCGVCHAVENRMNRMYENQYQDLDIYYITLEDSPLFRGKYLVFTIPTILLFANNKEIHRESRIIDFDKIHQYVTRYYD